MRRQVIFISSVQKELAGERRAICDYVRGDPLLRRFFDVFLFEDQPASDRRADDVYLDQVDRCDLYVGLFGNEYGREDAAGLSPTEREFDRATQQGKTRLIYVKGSADSRRHTKMAGLIRKAGDQLIRRRFEGVQDLTAAVYASLVEHLERAGMIQTRPFEERPCRDACLDDIDPRAVAAFLRRANNERQFPLAEDTPVAAVLTHLHLRVDGQLSNAAILLFGRDPQKFIPCAETRCMHFHGTEIRRPVPSYRIFKGNLFEQVDEAVDFVLSKVNRSIGTRAEGPRAPVRYELPENVVSEAIVNAVAHRDYTSPGAIQVSVFADRVEVWNPGELLPPLTAASLRKPHRSILRNTRIAEALYLAHYIEKYGTGTLMMIRESLEHELPEPGFGQAPGEFGITVWRDWLTDEVMGQLGLNERQMKAIAHLKTHGRISNPEYRAISGGSKQTASRDLEQLRDLQVLTRLGSTGKGTHYVLKTKGLTKGSMGSSEPKGSQRAQSAHESQMNPSQASVGESRRKAANHLTINRLKPSRKACLSDIKRHAQALGQGQIEAHVAVTDPVERSSQSTQSTDPVSRLLAALRPAALSPDALRQAVGIKHRPTFRANYLHPALEAGLIESTIPDKPTSRLQKYRLTDKGRAMVRMKYEG